MRVQEARIAVVDSSRLFRAGLISLLANDRTTPVAEAADVAELARAVAAGQAFDLVLLECPPRMENGAQSVEKVRALLPDARITILANHFEATQLRQCFAAGADGYLLKNISGESLQASLNLILLGEKLLPTSLADLLSRDGEFADSPPAVRDRAETRAMSDRELEILRCLVNGDSNKRIALRLKIAEATVKVHLKSILRKTQAANRTQAAIWAFQRGVAGMAAAGTVTVSHDKVATIGRIASNAGRASGMI